MSVMKEFVLLCVRLLLWRTCPSFFSEPVLFFIGMLFYFIDFLFEKMVLLLLRLIDLSPA